MKNIKSIIYATLFFTGFSIPNLGLKAFAEIPEPECVTALFGGNETACGYDCEISGDGYQAECADWPEGKCKAGWDSVSCGPSAPDNWQEEYESRGDYNRDRTCICDCDKRE